MNIDLHDKVVVITGAGRGIGRALARDLAHEGARVVACDLREDGLASLADDVGASGGHIRTYRCDVRDAARVREVLADAHAELGAIDVLVNNAGVVDDSRIEDLDEATWDLINEVNVKGTFLMCREAIPYMKSRRSGRIINAASFAAISPRVSSVAYASTKAAVAHFSRGLAGELGPWNITVNAYAPGMIPTEMNGFADLPADKQDELLDTLTIRRWGSTDDISALICFLASDHASYITGALIDISGGKLATQIPAEAYPEKAPR